jgi:hypothetical protein
MEVTPFETTCATAHPHTISFASQVPSSCPLSLPLPRISGRSVLLMRGPASIDEIRTMRMIGTRLPRTAPRDTARLQPPCTGSCSLPSSRRAHRCPSLAIPVVAVAVPVSGPDVCLMLLYSTHLGACAPPLLSPTWNSMEKRRTRRNLRGTPHFL